MLRAVAFVVLMMTQTSRCACLLSILSAGLMACSDGSRVPLDAAVPSRDGGVVADAGQLDAAADSGIPDRGWNTTPFDAGPVDARPQQSLLGQWAELPAGRFLRGSAEDEPWRGGDENRFEVTLTRPFLMKVTEVTQAEWIDVMGDNPSVNVDCGLNCPADNMSWFDAVRFTNLLSEREGFEPCYTLDGEDVQFAGLDCEGYRMPTEAEWEYACRSATNQGAYSNGTYYLIAGSLCPDDPNASEVGWYCFNSDDTLMPVGLKPANAWGLLDMHGNIGEWIHDWYHPGYYRLTLISLLDPVGPERPSLAGGRVLRGGAYYTGPSSMRCAQRSNGRPTGTGRGVGLRPVRTLKP